MSVRNPEHDDLHEIRHSLALPFTHK